MHGCYLITPPSVPAEDLVGPLGQRLLALLSRQAERDLRWLRQEAAGQDLAERQTDHAGFKPDVTCASSRRQRADAAAADDPEAAFARILAPIGGPR
jgi:hypothetical protein